MRMINDFLTFLGTVDGGGRWYLWWSGMFANVTIFVALFVFLRKHNCHIHGCWRMGSHSAVDANDVVHVVCRHHHPDLGPKHHLRPEHLVGRRATRIAGESAAAG
jgi:hypothetical protein